MITLVAPHGMVNCCSAPEYTNVSRCKPKAGGGPPALFEVACTSTFGVTVAVAVVVTGIKVFVTVTPGFGFTPVCANSDTGNAKSPRERNCNDFFIV